MAWVIVGRDGCLCKCERGRGFVEGGGVKGKPLMRAGCEVMSSCTIVVNWLIWSFVAQAGVGGMVWTFGLRGENATAELNI